MATVHSEFSSFRENVLEHLLIAQCLQGLWIRGHYNSEVLRADVDGAGFDIVMESNHVLRHIQLKASLVGGKTARQNLNLALSKKPSGCVIWMVVYPVTLNFDHFFWLGNAPGQALPDISDTPIAKHTKGNAEGFKAERANIRVISKSKFEKLGSVSEVIDRLFGTRSL